MKSCIEWRKGFKYKEQVDEFYIDFKNKPQKLLQFLETYANSQRVNIRITPDITDTQFDIILAIPEKYHIAVCFMWDDWKEQQLYLKLANKNIPFFFYKSPKNWDEFFGLLNLGVSDVFISQQMGFHLRNLHEIAKTARVQIRCYANICQNTWSESTGQITDFFIRPDDVDAYSQVVDVLEFYDSVDRQNIYYDIYFKSKKWDGNLQEIIKGLKVKVNNYYILGSEFAERRIGCQKKCLKGRRCQLCYRLIELADSLESSPDYQVFRRRQTNGTRESSEGTDI